MFMQCLHFFVNGIKNQLREKEKSNGSHLELDVCRTFGTQLGTFLWNGTRTMTILDMTFMERRS